MQSNRIAKRRSSVYISARLNCHSFLRLRTRPNACAVTPESLSSCRTDGRASYQHLAHLVAVKLFFEISGTRPWDNELSEREAMSDKACFESLDSEDCRRVLDVVTRNDIDHCM